MCNPDRVEALLPLNGPYNMGLREGSGPSRWHFDWPHNYEQATKDLGPLVKTFQYLGLFEEDSRYARASVTLLLYTEAI